MVQTGPTAIASSAPAGTVYIPAAASYSFSTSSIQIEGDDQHGVDVQFWRGPHHQRFQRVAVPTCDLRLAPCAL